MFYTILPPIFYFSILVVQCHAYWGSREVARNDQLAGTSACRLFEEKAEKLCKDEDDNNSQVELCILLTNCHLESSGAPLLSFSRPQDVSKAPGWEQLFLVEMWIRLPMFCSTMDTMGVKIGFMNRAHREIQLVNESNSKLEEIEKLMNDNTVLNKKLDSIQQQILVTSMKNLQDSQKLVKTNHALHREVNTISGTFRRTTLEFGKFEGKAAKALENDRNMVEKMHLYFNETKKFVDMATAKRFDLGNEALLATKVMQMQVGLICALALLTMSYFKTGLFPQLIFSAAVVLLWSLSTLTTVNFRFIIDGYRSINSALQKGVGWEMNINRIMHFTLFGPVTKPVAITLLSTLLLIISFQACKTIQRRIRQRNEEREMESNIRNLDDGDINREGYMPSAPPTTLSDSATVIEFLREEERNIMRIGRETEAILKLVRYAIRSGEKRIGAKNGFDINPPPKFTTKTYGNGGRTLPRLVMVSDDEFTEESGLEGDDDRFEDAEDETSSTGSSSSDDSGDSDTSDGSTNSKVRNHDSSYRNPTGNENRIKSEDAYAGVSTAHNLVVDNQDRREADEASSKRTIRRNKEENVAVSHRKYSEFEHTGKIKGEEPILKSLGSRSMNEDQSGPYRGTFRKGSMETTTNQRLRYDANSETSNNRNMREKSYSQLRYREPTVTRDINTMKEMDYNQHLRNREDPAYLKTAEIISGSYHDPVFKHISPEKRDKGTSLASDLGRMQNGDKEDQISGSYIDSIPQHPAVESESNRKDAGPRLDPLRKRNRSELQDNTRSFSHHVGYQDASHLQSAESRSQPDNRYGSYPQSELGDRDCFQREDINRDDDSENNFEDISPLESGENVNAEEETEENGYAFEEYFPADP